MSTVGTDEMVTAVFRDIDRMDAAEFARAFAEDGTFKFGNQPAAVGKSAVEEAVADFFAMLGGLHHETTGVWSGRWEGGEVRSVEGLVVYTRKDGSVVEPIPYVSTLRVEGDLIKDYRVFADISPLFAQSN